MESVLHKIHVLYPQMGFAEKKIADCILENTQMILQSSIGSFAKHCGCGNATLVRFARRLGYSGYQTLKIGIATELGSTSALNNAIIKEDSCYDIFIKQKNDILITLQETEGVLDKEELNRAAQALLHAQRIVVFGLGNSAAIATDLAHKLLRVGLNAQACCDNHMQAIIASHLAEGCVAVGISHSGASTDILDSLELAKMAGALTIGMTNYAKTPIVELSDIVLYTRADETKRSVLAMSSRIAQLAIIDALYAYIVIHTDTGATQAIYNTESALKRKKQG